MLELQVFTFETTISAFKGCRSWTKHTRVTSI